MSNVSRLDEQIATLLAMYGYTPGSMDCEDAMRSLMKEVIYWREAAQFPSKRKQGRPNTREMDSVRYKHLMGYVTDKLQINQEAAAEIISEKCIGLDNVEHEPKTILDLASGWKSLAGYASSTLFPNQKRYERHAGFLEEAAILLGNSDYFPEEVRELDRQP